MYEWLVLIFSALAGIWALIKLSEKAIEWKKEKVSVNIPYIRVKKESIKQDMVEAELEMRIYNHQNHELKVNSVQFEINGEPAYVIDAESSVNVGEHREIIKPQVEIEKKALKKRNLKSK